MADSPNARYLLPRFAVRLLSDLAVRSADKRRIVFTATHFSRTYGPGVQAPRGTDERVRIVLAVEALVLYGLSRKRAAQIVSKIMRRTEERTRSLANRYRGYRPIEFRFGRNARGKKTRESQKARSAATAVRATPDEQRDPRFAELDREMLEERMQQIAGKRARMAEERRCESIRVEALNYKGQIAAFNDFFDRAFRQFCDERSAKTRSPEFLRRAEAAFRERIRWFEEPDQRRNSGYDLGRVTHRYGLALLLHEQGDFDAALRLYEGAAERLRLSEFAFLPESRQEGLATLMRAMEDCRAGCPLRRTL
jgi:hypothetical protein